MSRPRRRPVVYRSHVCLWVVALAVAIASTVLFVAASPRQVVAFVIQGVSVLAAAALWRFGEHRVHRLRPPTTTGINLQRLAGILVMIIIANTIAKNGSFAASVAGIATAVAGVAPWLIFATALLTPPPGGGTSELLVIQPNQADVDQAGPADGHRP